MVEAFNGEVEPGPLMMLHLLAGTVIFSPNSEMIVRPSLTFFHIPGVEIGIKNYFLERVIRKFVPD